uniref:Ig-like domain-containing protein n=1 Tax=Hucho hucho TaxID=62062 RepID=A0A4W5JLD9_9TELE
MIIMYKSVLYLCCALNKDVIQPDPVTVTHLGQSVSLTCVCRSNLIRVSWYKQTVGKKPILMASSYHGTENSFYYNNFTEEFTETKRLSLRRGFDSCNLTISKTESGDSATYYCVSTSAREVKFGEGTVLIVKGNLSWSNCMSVLQQPVSESVQPGDSVTLNCTIHTETCAGEHSGYWFRHGSGKSHPGIIYTHGDRNDQCEKSSEAWSPRQSCVYNLPKRNLSLSDAGTYYCAVASCGEILFGNGTKLEMDCGCKEDHLLLVYCLGVALALCFILIIVLCCVMYKMTKKTYLLSKGKRYHCPQYMIELLVNRGRRALVRDVTKNPILSDHEKQDCLV